MSNTLGNLDWSNPATIIALAVDNNPQAVAAGLLERGYTIQGLSIDQYKDLLMLAYERGLDLTWLGKIQYNATEGNWTGELYRQAQVGANAKFTWETLGQVLAVAGTTLMTIFGAKPGSTPTPTQPPVSNTIMGISKDVFYPLLMILIVIIIMVIFVVTRKK